jgi:archaellum component FlaG (FlaF/FlaG flagellin family)
VGESTAIAHAVFIIVSVMMASVLALVVLGKLSYMESVFSQAVREKSAAVGIRLLIVNAYRDSQTGMIYVYVKNVGTLPFSYLNGIDVYIGNYTGVLDYYKYNTSASSPGTFNITELGSEDGSWAPGETLRFNINPSATYGDVVRVRIVLPNGVLVEDVVELVAG